MFLCLVNKDWTPGTPIPNPIQMGHLGTAWHLALVGKLVRPEAGPQSRFLWGCSLSSTQEGSISTGCDSRRPVKGASIILSKKPVGPIIQLKNFRSQGRMHFNDSRERIKLNTLSRISFPCLLSPAFSRPLCAPHSLSPWPAAPPLQSRCCPLAKEGRTGRGLRSLSWCRSSKVRFQQDEVS